MMKDTKQLVYESIHNKDIHPRTKYKQGKDRCVGSTFVGAQAINNSHFEVSINDVMEARLTSEALIRNWRLTCFETHY